MPSDGRGHQAEPPTAEVSMATLRPSTPEHLSHWRPVENSENHTYQGKRNGEEATKAQRPAVMQRPANGMQIAMQRPRHN